MDMGEKRWAYDAAFSCISGLGMPKDIVNLITERIVVELLKAKGEACEPLRN